MTRIPKPAHDSIVFAVTLYTWLLHVYPRSFRDRFAREMIQVFRVSCRDALQQGTQGELVVLLLGTIPDILDTALREHVTQGQYKWRNTMSPTLGTRFGSVMAIMAICAMVGSMLFGAFVTTTLRGYGIYPSDVIGSVSQIAVFLVLAMMTKTQHTRLGRFSGGMALLGVGLHIILIDTWITFPLFNQHSHVLKAQVPEAFAATGGVTTLLGLIGVSGLIGTTLRYHELDRWQSGSLFWWRWTIVGMIVGALVLIFWISGTSLSEFVQTEIAFAAVSTWAYLAGTGLGLLRSVAWANAISSESPNVNTD
jgi:hypothetical protein